MNGFRDIASALTTPVSMFAPIALFIKLLFEPLIRCVIKPAVVVLPFVPVTLIFVSMYLLHSLRKFGSSFKTNLPIIEVPAESPVVCNAKYAMRANKSDK